MTADTIHRHLIAGNGAVEEYPFGPGARVFKVAGKMFALLAHDETPPSVTLKCDPEHAEELRAQYPTTVVPGYYMNKRHWNTVTLDDTVPPDEVFEMCDDAYDLVVRGLKRSERESLLSDSPAP